MRKVVLFNGPPNSGKDYLADLMVSQLGASKKMFKQRLYEITAAIYGIDLVRFVEMASSRTSKELPNKELGGLSPRQAMIKVSEEVIKPKFGKDYFGKALAKNIGLGLTVISDGGFDEELDIVTYEVGVENLVVVKLEAEGCSFVNDSRKYVDSEGKGIRTVYMFNHKDKATSDAVITAMEELLCQ